VPPDSFIDALKPHYNDALRYCRLLCADWDVADAEDVLQQAMLQALEHFNDLREPAKFKSWLFQILYRTYLKARRRRFWNRFTPLDSLSDLPRFPAVFNRPMRSEDQWLLLQALSILSPKERATFLLFEVAGFSIEEVRHLQEEKSPSTIKMRLSRARKKMKAHLHQIDSNKSVKLHPSRLTGDIENETLKIISEAHKERRID